MFSTGKEITQEPLVFTNLFVDRGRITGVYDWSKAVLADPAFDVAGTRARLGSDIPGLPLPRLVQRALERRYLASYRRRRAVDPRALQYFDTFWLLHDLAWGLEKSAQGMAPTSDVRDRWLDPEVRATALDPLRVHAKLPRCVCQPQPLKRRGHSFPRRYAKAFRIASGLFPRGEIIVRTVTQRFALLLCFALAAGCASTKLVDSWAAPGVDASDFSFQHVVAIAAVPQVSRQRIAEDALEAAATETKVTAAYKIVSQEDRADTARLRTVLEENGIDGAIVVELIGVKDKETYVPPRATTIPSGYYGYWRRAGAVVYEPGYTRTDTYVRVKTSLFDVAGGKLLWSGESQTMNPTSVDKLIEEIVRAAGRDLKKRGLIQ